jgi:prevent-host-death family protein
MSQQVWQLQEAKNKLSQVVEQALTEGPQTITRNGVEAVVVLSMQAYRKMLVSRGSVAEFFRESPLAGSGLDLERDKRGWQR